MRNVLSCPVVFWAWVLFASCWSRWRGWVLVWVFLYKSWYESGVPGSLVDTSAEAWAMSRIEDLSLAGTPAGELIRGIGLWAFDAGAALPGLVIGFCQVGVLTAVAV